MSREIKFRALAPVRAKSGKLYWWNDVYTDGDQVYIDTKHGHCLLKDVKALCQFTGLQDKSGVDIYEGDVIKHANGLCDGEVRYWEGAFIAGTSSANSALVNYNAPMMIEVISNVHLNAELLGGGE